VMMLSVATFTKYQWQMNDYELLRKWYWHGKTEVPWETCPSATSSTTYSTWTGPNSSEVTMGQILLWALRQCSLFL
jgi:hypothetical protein